METLPYLLGTAPIANLVRAGGLCGPQALKARFQPPATTALVAYPTL